MSQPALSLTPLRSRELPDVQAEAPAIALALDEAGITDLRYPITVHLTDGSNHSTIATVSLVLCVMAPITRSPLAGVQDCRSVRARTLVLSSGFCHMGSGASHDPPRVTTVPQQLWHDRMGASCARQDCPKHRRIVQGERSLERIVQRLSKDILEANRDGLKFSTLVLNLISKSSTRGGSSVGRAQLSQS